MLENSATQMGTEMLDTQFAGKLTGLPGGLSEVIARQLQRQMGLAADASSQGQVRVQPLPALAKRNIAPHVQDFIQRHDEAAKAAEQQTGIPASFMLAQAAHESGWGRREIKLKDGSPSHNVFGIKATSAWQGPVAEVTTTEFIDGKARKVVAKFRAYASYEEAFKDYARLLGSNARYSEVVAKARNGGNAASFAQGLQKAGYATDPEYASKLARVINTTVRVQRAMA
jgi:flagellar protein FlgJ